MADPSLARFRIVVQRALDELEARRDEVNDLNVFPVADGDTGDNMALTLRAVLDELDRLARRGAIEDIGRDEIVDSVARAALLGARGNSGVILSQLIRGAAEALIKRPGQLVDPALIMLAMRNASSRALESVTDPAEGTILTVAAAMAERVVDEVGRMDEPRLRQGDDERQDALIADVLEDALEAGQASVLKGPELLPALADAGVVDAGGYGLTIIFAGVIAALRGADAPDLDHHAPARVTHPEHESSTFRYCTNFAVTGTELAAAQTFRPALEAIGDSVLVVGDHRTLKVHVHTDDPDRATAIFEALGEVSRLDIADMHAQVAARTERLEASRQTCGVLAVVSGSGMAQEFGDLQVTVLDGGRTMNPSTTEILARLHAVPAEEVIVLPNSPNVVMAAEAAAQLSEKRVVVVPSRSQQAGLALAYLLRPDAGAEENAAAMQAELATLRTASVAVAARDDAGARFRRGEAIGYVDDELVAWGAPDQTLSAVLEDLAKDASSVVVYAADDAPLDEDAVSALAPEGLELDQLYGGQPSYWWLLSTE